MQEEWALDTSVQLRHGKTCFCRKEVAEMNVRVYPELVSASVTPGSALTLQVPE